MYFDFYFASWSATKHTHAQHHTDCCFISENLFVGRGERYSGNKKSTFSVVSSISAITRLEYDKHSTWPKGTCSDFGTFLFRWNYFRILWTIWGEECSRLVRARIYGAGKFLLEGTHLAWMPVAWAIVNVNKYRTPKQTPDNGYTYCINALTHEKMLWYCWNWSI